MNRELDLQVAKEIMFFASQNPSEVPPFSSDYNFAMTVRDRISGMLFSKRKAFTETCRDLVEKRMFSERERSDRRMHHSEVIVHVTAEDICIAALAAVRRYPRIAEGAGGSGRIEIVEEYK